MLGWVGLKGPPMRTTQARTIVSCFVTLRWRLTDGDSNGGMSCFPVVVLRVEFLVVYLTRKLHSISGSVGKGGECDEGASAGADG
ncbi:hypothetical protein L209DRAFT_756397 [Thermothelomyces heterothallicus CBS 203.75]